jgi:uncharacterized surface protein with fasciclin (FAS1) repeats
MKRLPRCPLARWIRGQAGKQGNADQHPDLPRDFRSVRLQETRRRDQGRWGKTELKTVNGESLTFMENGPHNIVVADASGNTADISTYDVMQRNGVVMVVDKVLLPK